MLNELRKAGKIKRLGFSFHGSAEQLSEILAAGDWDFVQLQLNYFDWDYQQSRKKYELCAAAGLQVIVKNTGHILIAFQQPAGQFAGKVIAGAGILARALPQNFSLMPH